MLTPMDIHNKEFSRSFRGYNEDEIDAFLDEVVNDFEAILRQKSDLADEVESLKRKLALAESAAAEMPRRDDTLVAVPAAVEPADVAQLRGELAQYRELEKSLRETLFIAQKEAAERKAIAEKEAQAKLAEAEEKARQMIEAAGGRVEELMAKARQEADATVAKAVEEADRQKEAAHNETETARLEVDNLRHDAEIELAKKREESEQELAANRAEQQKLKDSSRAFLIQLRSLLAGQLDLLNKAGIQELMAEAGVDREPEPAPSADDEE